MFIIEDPNVTAKCRTAMKVLFIYSILGLVVPLHYFVSKCIVFHVHLHPYPL
jgi:hypothetical protein